MDCCTLERVGWALYRHCRAGEWTAAVRMALELRGVMEKAICRALGLVLRSDNGSQPCSERFVEFLNAHGVRGQYTAYDVPDDNAYGVRLIPTIKEEDVWPNLRDTPSEARQVIVAYVTYSNEQHPHLALHCQARCEIAATFVTRAA